MKNYKHVLLIAACVFCAVFAACSNDNPNTTPIPTQTAKPLDTADASYPPGSDEKIGWTVREADDNVKKAILDEQYFGIMTEDLIYYGASGDLNADGKTDYVLVLANKSDFDENFENYSGSDLYFTTNVYLGDTEPILIASTNELASSGADQLKTALKELKIADGKLTAVNASSVVTESFEAQYDSIDKKLYLTKYTLDSPENEYPVYIEDTAVNFGKIDLNSFVYNFLLADMVNDLKMTNTNIGTKRISMIYPDFKIENKTEEAALVSQIDSAFSAITDAIKQSNINDDFSILCSKVFQAEGKLSFIFEVISDTTNELRQVSAVSFERSENGGYKLVKPSAQHGAQSLISMAKSQSSEMVLMSKYSDEQIQSAFSSIDRNLFLNEFTVFSFFKKDGVQMLVNAFEPGQVIDFFGNDASGMNTVVVYNAKEFVSAIKSNTKIQLKPGSYNLSDVTDNLPEGVKIRSGGSELLISGFENLTIEGVGSSVAEIISSNSSMNVIGLSNCHNVQISNLKITHSTKAAMGSGAALLIKGGSDIVVSGSNLCASGMGLAAEGTTGLSILSSVIENCTQSIFKITDVTDASIKSCSIRNNRGNNMIAVDQCEGVTIESCDIKNNSSESGFSFFSVRESSVELRNSSLTNNFGQQSQKEIEQMKIVSVNSANNGFQVEFNYASEPLKKEDLSIGVISPGMTEQEVQQKLMVAISSAVTLSEKDSYRYDTVTRYNGIDVGFAGGVVTGIRANGMNLSTKRGITFGDSVEKIYEKYGYEINVGGFIDYVYGDESGDFSEQQTLFFYIENGKAVDFGVRPFGR